MSNDQKCMQCFYRVPNVSGQYCCTFYIHPRLRKKDKTGPPIGAAWTMCKGKHFQQRVMPGAGDDTSIRERNER